MPSRREAKQRDLKHHDKCGGVRSSALRCRIHPREVAGSAPRGEREKEAGFQPSRVR